MARHFRSKHPYIYAKHTKQINMDRQTDNNVREKPIIVQKKITQKKRAWILKYIRKLTTGVYQCVICKASLKMPKGLYGNMKRHFARLHPSIYKKETSKNTIDTNDNREVNLPVDKQSSKKEICKVLKVVESMEGENEKQRNYVYIIEESVTEKGQAVDLDKVVKDTNLEFIHYENEVENEIVLGPEEQFQMSDPDIENKIKNLCQRGPKGKRGNYKTCFWNFFKQIEGDVYACLFCFRTVTIFTCRVTNLTRHLKLKHKNVFELILKFIPEHDPSNTRNPKYISDRGTSREPYNASDFEIVEDGFKCKICDEILNNEEDNLNLFEHMRESHPNQVVLCRDQLLGEDELNTIVITAESVPKI